MDYTRAPSPIHFECRLERVIELGPKRQALMIGEVVHIDVDPAAMTDGNIDMRKLDPVRPPQRLPLRDAR
jgi:flavin reductase (DIM6/NTAB) family NADH-FMN oxidoreductase RutF